MLEVIVVAIGVLLLAVSAYGWWFHVEVGPAHGAGMEIGVLAGIHGLPSFALAWRVRSK